MGCCYRTNPGVGFVDALQNCDPSSRPGTEPSYSVPVTGTPAVAQGFHFILHLTLEFASGQIVLRMNARGLFFAIKVRLTPVWHHIDRCGRGKGRKLESTFL